ncbi:MAG: SpoIIE family protein phosphatase [Ilumatobacteraceae bacterium]
MTPQGSTPRDTWSELGPALADVFDAVLSPFALLSTSLQYVAVNTAYCEVVGRSADDLIGRAVFDVFPEPEPEEGELDEAQGLRRSLEFALLTGGSHTMPLLRYDVAEIDSEELVERYWHVTNVAVPHPDGTPWLVLNHPEEVTDFIDERLRLEAAGSGVVAQSSSQMQAVDTAFTAAIERLQNLNDLASALVGATDADAVGHALLRYGLSMVGAAGGTFVIGDGDRVTMMDHRGIDLATADRWSSFTLTAGAEPFSDAMHDGHPRFFSSRREFLEAYPGLVTEVEANDHHAWVVLPLSVAGNVTGVIGLVYDAPNPFAEPLRLVMYTLASLVAQGLARAQLIEEQAAAVRSIEATLQPSLDPIEGVLLSGLYRPASAATNAGGDWYDVIEVSERCTLIAIGDVANHGPVAVGEMARTRATVHALALQELGPEEIATQANRVLSHIASTFTTSVIAVYDRETKILTWTTAGHPYPLLRTSDGSAQFLSYTHGPPLGAGVAADYDSTARVLEPGDTLVLFTDGLVERSDEPIDDALERLRLAVEQLPITAQFATDIYESLNESDRHNDDIAVLTLHLTPDPTH